MATRIDFLRPPRPPVAGWGLLAAGILAMGLATWQAHQWSDDHAVRVADLQARQAETEQARQSALRKAPPSPDDVRMQRVAAQLREPWLPTLRLIEHVTASPVYLLGLSIDPASGLVRLDGQAATFDQVLGYQAELDQASLLGPAHLRSHEVVVDPGGRAAVRFSISTHWSLP